MIRKDSLCVGAAKAGVSCLDENGVRGEGEGGCGGLDGARLGAGEGREGGHVEGGVLVLGC